MKKILAVIFILLILLFSLAILWDDQSPYGPWECVIPENAGVVTLDIDPSSHIFSMNVLDVTFSMPFKTFIVDGDKTGLILLTPDNIAHGVHIVKKKDGISLSFHDIPEIPALECRRPEKNAPVGH